MEIGRGALETGVDLMNCVIPLNTIEEMIWGGFFFLLLLFLQEQMFAADLEDEVGCVPWGVGEATLLLFPLQF